MRIAFITSEFSGLPGSGGIGSYFLHAAQCLVATGAEVEVFTLGKAGELGWRNGVTFHQLGTGESPVFAVHAAAAFAARHAEKPFDLLEYAELKAEGQFAAKLAPEVATVVRMHSPSALLNRYLDLPPSRWQLATGLFRQCRMALGAWWRGLPLRSIQLGAEMPVWFPNNEIEERNAVAAADLVIVMSEEMRRFARDHWWIADEAIIQVPNPLRLTAEVSPSPEANAQHRLGFIGRLEPRKGVLELAAALEQVLPKHSDWSVVFAGPSVPSCLSGADVGKMTADRLKSFGSRITFAGPVPPDQTVDFLGGLDLCVFPSLWDNFPYVVLEAMAMSRPVIATRVGAVPDMLDRGRAGYLVDPGNIHQLAEALDLLMSGPKRRQALGEAARQRFLDKYNETIVTSAILGAYRLAMERRDRRLEGNPGPISHET